MFQNKWKLTAISLALVIVLLASCFVILYKPEAAQAKEPVLLDVSIDGKAKLNVDELSNYKVNVVGGVGELSYDWSFTPADGKARFYDNGPTANIVFKNATEEPYLLEVKVYDAAGNFGVASMAVYDPPTFPSTYLGVYGAPYSYMIKADGTGWYYAIDGNTGAVAWSSTNATIIYQNVASNMINGTKVNVKGGTYPISSSVTWSTDVELDLDQNAILQWIGPDSNQMFVNSVPINLVWKGGVVDCGNKSSGFGVVGFGMTEGSSPASTYLKNCYAENILFKNIGAGAWECNAITNQNIYWVNIGGIQATGAQRTDLFETMGTNIHVDVWGITTNSVCWIWTSSYLIDGYIHSDFLNSTFQSPDVGQGNMYNIMLQAYAGTGPSDQSVYNHVTLQGNGDLFLNTGDYTTYTVVGNDIHIIADWAHSVQIGNDKDIWNNVQVTGNIYVRMNHPLLIGNVQNLVLDLSFDGSGLTGTSGNSMVYMNAVNLTKGSIIFKNLIVSNAPSSVYAGIFQAGPANYIKYFSLLAGDASVTQGVTTTLFTSGSKGAFGTQTQYLSASFNGVTT